MSHKRYIDRISQVVDKLNIQKRFIEEALLNPQIMFEDASIIFRSSNRETVFNIMSVYEDNQRKMDTHEFQQFLCEIVSKFFECYFRDEKIKVRLRNPNSFPSLFAVYYDGEEIIQFDIFERFYGKRDLKIEKELNEEFQQHQKDYSEEKSRLENKMAEWEFARDNLIKYALTENKDKSFNIKVKNLYYAIYYSVFKQKNVIRNTTKMINKFKDELKTSEEYYNKRCELNNRELEQVKELESIAPKIERLFTDHNYHLETERYKLF